LPTPCPSRLKELIALANLEPDSEALTHLRAIAQAFRAKRQKKTKASASVQIELKQTIKVLLADGTVETSRDELELVLAQIEPPSKIDLIRECPKCREIFWAVRADKEACDRHTAAWSKQEWRRKTKEKEAKRAKERERRAKSPSRTDKPLSLTSKIILEAIANQNHLFSSIDYYCFWELNRSRRYGGNTYRTATVTRCLELLVDSEYIHRAEREDGDFWYTLRNKAKKLFH